MVTAQRAPAVRSVPVAHEEATVGARLTEPLQEAATSEQATATVTQSARRVLGAGEFADLGEFPGYGLQAMLPHPSCRGH